MEEYNPDQTQPTLADDIDSMDSSGNLISFDEMEKKERANYLDKVVQIIGSGINSPEKQAELEDFVRTYGSPIPFKPEGNKYGLDSTYEFVEDNYFIDLPNAMVLHFCIDNLGRLEICEVISPEDASYLKKTMEIGGEIEHTVDHALKTGDATEIQDALLLIKKLYTTLSTLEERITDAQNKPTQ